MATDRSGMNIVALIIMYSGQEELTANDKLDRGFRWRPLPADSPFQSNDNCRHGSGRSSHSRRSMPPAFPSEALSPPSCQSPSLQLSSVIAAAGTPI